MNTQSTTYKQNILKYGLIAGVLTVLILMVLYIINRELMINPMVINMTTLFFIAGMFAGGRKEQEGKSHTLSYLESMRVAFGIYVIANVLYYLFIYTFYNYIDPSLVDVINQNLADQGQDMEKYEVGYHASILFQNFIVSTLFGFILSMILSVFIRR